MDPQVQGSFIPKAPLNAPRSAGGSFLLLISLFIFVLSILAAGAAFGYERYLNASIASKDETLRRAEGAFDSGVIRDLVRLDARLVQGGELVRGHIAPSALFDFLERETLERVQFTAFDYARNPDGSASLSLDGVAADFSTLALQSDRFGGGKALRDVIFSAITVAEGGRIEFTVSASVDPALLRYGAQSTANPVVQQVDNGTGDQQSTSTSSPQGSGSPQAMP